MTVIMLLPLLLLLGLSIGSFLNCLVYRLNEASCFRSPTIRGVMACASLQPATSEEGLASRFSLVRGRSYCDHCKKQLAWFDNIPLLSFVFLKGKCRHCRKPISWQYPLVELGTGIVFAIGGIRLIGEIGGIREMGEFLFFLFISSVLITIFVSDLKYQIIPDQVIYPAILLTLLYSVITYYILHTTYYILIGFAAAGFFLLLYLVTKRRGMGLGDVKLAFLMGLLLGWPKILLALYFAFLTGAAVGVILILTGKKKFGQHIPFGPFLVAGTFVAWFLGERILGYLSYLGYL